MTRNRAEWKEKTYVANPNIVKGPFVLGFMDFDFRILGFLKKLKQILLDFRFQKS